MERFEVFVQGLIAKFHQKIHQTHTLSGIYIQVPCYFEDLKGSYFELADFLLELIYFVCIMIEQY